MADDRQRVVIVKFIVKFVKVGVSVGGLCGTRPAVRRVMLLTCVICIASLRTEKKKSERSEHARQKYADTNQKPVLFSMAKILKAMAPTSRAADRHWPVGQLVPRRKGEKIHG